MGLWFVVCEKKHPFDESVILINHMGFVTIESQPGVNKSDIKECSELQRGHVRGFMLKDQTETFILR